MADSPEEILRRKTDEMYGAQLAECKAGIQALQQSMYELREGIHTQMTAISVQIAKLPVPMTLNELEERFVLRREHDERRELIDALLNTFVTKEEARPIKTVLFTLMATLGVSIVAAIITYVLK